MRNSPTRVFFLILWCATVCPLPVQVRPVLSPQPGDAHGQVISVRITSSVAVGRSKGKPNTIHENKHETPPTSHPTPLTQSVSTAVTDNPKEPGIETTTIPPELAGANIEFIKQLHSKKEARGLQHFEMIHSFPSLESHYSNVSDDSVDESSVKSVLKVNIKNDEMDEGIENIPLARSIPLSLSSKNYIQGLIRKPISERGNNQRLTTVSFDILHDTPKVSTNYNEPSDPYVTPEQPVSKAPKYYRPPKFYNEPAKVYSEPAQIYSEPAKYYSEPAKIYSEPARIYSEPAKIYSEPAKIYSEPAKFYSEPASLHLPSDQSSWQHVPSRSGTTVTTPAPYTTVAAPSKMIPEHRPESNYEVDEKLSVLSDGRSHGVQESSSESCAQEKCKVGYVVEGRQYRKYRVEERTPDGFIVGEYGVVRHEDGALRGVRYTADGAASPSLIHDALMKFLQLK